MVKVKHVLFLNIRFLKLIWIITIFSRVKPLSGSCCGQLCSDGYLPWVSVSFLGVRCEIVPLTQTKYCATEAASHAFRSSLPFSKIRALDFYNAKFFFKVVLVDQYQQCWRRSIGFDGVGLATEMYPGEVLVLLSF